MTETATEAGLLPPPLLGCLYCHAEGTTTLAEGRKVLGLGSNTPTITCSTCGAVAFFEAGEGQDQWRIRYRSINKASRYYYVMIHLGQAGWLESEEALEQSRVGFVQRQRVQQTQRGDLSWLRRIALNPPPPLMSPEEAIYLTLNPASLQQGAKNGGVLARTEGVTQDTGRVYVTDRKLHLLGHRRDWTHKLTEIQRVDHNEQHWRVYVGDGSQYYQGENLPNQLDAQLFATVVKTLWTRKAQADD